MLKKQIEAYLKAANGAVGLPEEEREYAERHGMLTDIPVNELSSEDRFAKAYIERGNKETEEFLGEESFDFLKKPIGYFSENKNEFMYMESEWFNMIGVDAVSFEKDDVFGNYDVMLGLKLQKKYEQAIKSYLNENIQGEGSRYDLMFDGNEGLWSLNFALNNLEGFRDDFTIGEAYSLIYRFLFRLAELVENRH